MHAPDGFLEPRVAVATAVIALAVLALGVRRTSNSSDDVVPLAGVAAAFVFAAQMLNFPVASGTTGHLLGGALAAILLGPWMGSLVAAVVVVAQALVFADGGIAALGYNLVNMAIVPVFGGWALFRLFRHLLPANAGGVIGATALASGISVVLAAGAFSLEWLFGASAPVPFDTVFGAMVGVHTLIGIGEGTISGLAVATALAARPDLVTGARDLPAAALVGRPRIAARTFVIAGALVASFLAVVVSQFAADGPDGLERVAEDHGFSEQGRDHAWGDTLFADYATQGIGNETMSLAVAGVSGVVITGLVTFGIVAGSRWAGPRPAA